MSEPATILEGRHVDDGRALAIRIDGDRIASVEPLDVSEASMDDLPWIAPRLIDIQINGRWGISFSDPGLTVDQVAEVVRAQPAMGVGWIFPTLISATREATIHALRTIDAACRRWPDVDRRVLGIHLEGPYLSDLEGYRGAHPVEVLHDPDLDEFEAFRNASGDRIRILTLAPERTGSADLIAHASRLGILVALGHTNMRGPDLSAAVEAGARLSTHLGNGIRDPQRRHPNPIWLQAAEDRLHASMIADGHHLDPSTLRVLIRAKTPARTVLVSDASPLAGLEPGRYGDWEIATDGRVVVAGTPYLAGANRDLLDGVAFAKHHAGLTLSQALDLAIANPARLLGHARPTLEVGQPADIMVFHAIESNKLEEGSCPMLRLVEI